MDGVTIKIDTSYFFDRKKVIKAVDKASRNSMSKGAAYIRRTARSSIKKRKKAVSKPGQPPRSHTSNRVVTIRNIQFNYDPATKSAKVGSIKLNGSRKIKATTTVTNVLEFGGTVRFAKGALVPSTRRSGSLGAGDYYVVKRPFTKRYQARPFMAPALKKEVAKGTILNSWKGQVSE